MTNLFLEAQRFSFYESFLYAWWMTRIKIRILKGLSLFVMRLHIEGGVSVESLAFVHFHCIVVVVCSLNKFFDIVLVCVPQTEDIVNISLLN